MDSWKAEVRRVRREKIRRKKMQMREKVGKSRFTVFFQWFVAPEGRKVGSLKRRVRSQLARWEMKNCTPLWREAHFEVKMYKTHQVRTTFGSWDVEKVHAVVARSTFWSQNVQNTPTSDHFWKLRCRKSARRCGAKHISKSKCTKHTMFGPLLEAQMSTFEKVHAVVARSTFPSENVQNTPCSDHFWKLRCRVSKKCTPLWREAHFEVKMLKTLGFWITFGGSDVASLRFTSLHYTTLRYTTLHYTTLHYTTLHYTTLHYTTLLYLPLHFTTLHYTTTTTTTTQPHSTTLQLQLQLHNYTPIRSTTPHYTPLHKITLHYTTLHCTKLHYLPLQFTTLNYTPLHYTTTTLHYVTLHYLPLHFITLHYTPKHYSYNYTTTLHYTPLH